MGPTRSPTAALHLHLAHVAFVRRLNVNNQCNFATLAASQWLALRLQLIGVALTTGVAFLAVIEHHRVDTTTGEIRGECPSERFQRRVRPHDGPLMSARRC